MFGTDPDQVAPLLAPYLARLPAQVARSARGGGLPADGDQRATFRASHAAMLELVPLAWSRGITIVAGTDDMAGLALPRELELYVAAAIPAPDVLALDTLGAARVMRQDAVSGSIAVGKQADRLLVDGDPTTDIGTLRNADLVVCRGRVYDPTKLFAAVGVGPRRK
jgi:imidazolonepropionase-like amidohydrolase